MPLAEMDSRLARSHNKLTARGVEALRKPGRHSDGGGLYLHISKAPGVNGRRWIFRYTSPTTGKVREMGLGSAAKDTGLSLATAREEAANARSALKAGLDPIDARDRARQEEEAAKDRRKTFGDVVEEFLGEMESDWRNAKHRQQWRNTLTTYGAPIADTPVNDIGADEVFGVLKPIWRKKPETASRVRGRIERVLSFAVTRGWRDAGPNPAVWRGTLDTVLPRRDRLTRGHHKALPYAEVPAFVAELRVRDALSARLMEFTILTACRTQESVGARWDEFDMENGVWSIPATRMKTKKLHRVPLSPAAIAVVEQMKQATSSDYVFPGQKPGRPVSTMTMLALLRRMDRHGQITTHGFRSAFSDWCAEQTSFSSEVREMALAHTIANKAEAAYRRGDLLEKRRELMEAWAAWCIGDQN